MTLAYVPPGVSVNEVINPTFSPFSVDPTSICIIGPGRGYENHSEVLLLEDNNPVVLSSTGVTFTPTVTDASDPLGTAFSSGTDFIFNAAASTIKRAMQTQIANGEQVVVYYTDASTGYTEWPTLTKLQGYAPTNRSVTVTRDNIFVQREGVIPTGDYVVTAGTGGGNHTIRVSGSPSILTPASKQRVYVYYADITGATNSVLVTLNGSSDVTIPSTGNTNAASIVVKNAATSVTTPAIRYVLTSGGTDNDYVLNGLTGSGSGATAESATISRSPGSTTMGATADALQVRVVYQATPDEYYLPTRCFSLGDVEQKYGPALDSLGNVSSPVTLAAQLAFANGASDLVVQALFTTSVSGVKSPGGVGDATQNLSDWVDTLEVLRDIEDINVLVPVISSSGGTSTDPLSLQIFQAFATHTAYMAQNGQYLVTICGEDSTAAGNVASKSVLQSHAQSLASGSVSETLVLVSPAAFTYANAVTGQSTSIGGQYVAACIAGQLAGRGIQETLTHKTLASITGVSDFRSEMDKNSDAGSGLLVVENKRGSIRVRHAVTTAVDDINTRELSVIRAKQYMLETLRGQLEDQVVGQIVADGNAVATVELQTIDVLERLIDEKALVTYQDIQARQITNDPTKIEIRFSYLPAWPLNYVDIVFSINTAAGTVTTDDSEGV